MSELQAVNSVFNIEIEKIDPNPNQPRQHFSEEALRDLAESIRRYGVMQPITVVRREQATPEGGMATRYEIVAGERRWRASVIAGMSTIPAIIREEEETEQDRFELSVLENLQREDLNPVDKARSFQRLSEEFGMRHAEIADRLGKSREYVTNSMRLLELPENILDALAAGEISEGHTRPMLTLRANPDELQVLFNEIKTKHLTVRQAEQTAKVLMKGGGPVKSASTTNPAQTALDPEMQALQEQLSDTLGTSVSIDKRDKGGKLTIDFFSREDLKKILELVKHTEGGVAEVIAASNEMMASQEQPSSRDVSHTVDNHKPEASPEEASSFNQAVPVNNHEAADNKVVTTQVSGSDMPSDFVRDNTSEPTNNNNVDLGDDFTITPRKGGMVLDESLQGKEIQKGSAHEAPQARSFAGGDVASKDISSNTDFNFKGGNPHKLQEEVDALVGQVNSQVSPSDIRSGLERMKVDIGELSAIEPEYNTSTNASKEDTTDGMGVQLARENINTTDKAASAEAQSFEDAKQDFSSPRGVESRSVSEVSNDFVPPRNEDIPVGELESEVEAGEDFVPRESGISEGAEVTMGQLGGMQPGTISGHNNSPNQGVPSEKYPDGDPYRLDNFSI